MKIRHKEPTSAYWRVAVCPLMLAILFTGCAGDIPGGKISERDTALNTPERVAFLQQTVALRGTLSVPVASDRLSQQELVEQLPSYDPGSLLRCGLNENEQYRAAVDALGGIRWDYKVPILDDSSQPIFQKGLPDESMFWVSDASAESGAGVEIEEADIVGLNEEAALFASNQHGLLLVSLIGDTPQFVCGAKLPGLAKKFYYYNGQLVVMAEGITPGVQNHSLLLHFQVQSNALTFIEFVDLGPSRVLDSRRFNEKLVIYTDMAMAEDTNVDPQAAMSPGDAMPVSSAYSDNQHRQLHVFNWGKSLTEEMTETQISDVAQIEWMEVTPETHAVGDLVHRSSYYGNVLFASDRYFVVTESVRESYLEQFVNESYNHCAKYHTWEVPYTHCWTKYETRPNPNYVPPDNTGGDRACSGATLSDCLRHVATVSNETIEVPIGRECENRIRTKYRCDEYETVQYTVPYYRNEESTSLAIYEYTENGFIRFASEVAAIRNDDLSQMALSDTVDSLTTSSEKFDLKINGRIQTLYFQNGFLYVIAQGTLQVYAMGDHSLVRTSTLDVVNDTLQTTLFTDDTIYLSDFSWNYGRQDTSQLKLVDLTNPGFPTLVAQTQELPGGHTHILAVNEGIFTIGTVSKFEGQSVQALKLGLFGDPAATELSYLILGTDISWTNISSEKEYYFDYNFSRLFLPYTGHDETTQVDINRVGISHMEGDQIVSEGALDTPERLLRVRPEPGADRLMGFGNNLIESIAPSATGWEMQPILQHYTPIALYRYTDEDDYVEVLQLGNQCRLHFAKADALNQRDETAQSASFICPNSVWAYEHNILFGQTVGFAFTVDGTLTPLTSAQIAVLYDASSNRQYCLLSTTERYKSEELPVVFDTTSYSIDDFTCMPEDEYWKLGQDF